MSNREVLSEGATGGCGVPFDLMMRMMMLDLFRYDGPF
jgi:hypothetical protein